MIANYSENTTPKNRWSMVFQNEYVQLTYLRLNGYDDIKYLKKITNYIPKDDAVLSCEISIRNIDSGSKCLLFDDPLMKQATNI